MNKLPNLIYTILIAVFIQFLITGCGGGSSGTDNGGSIKIKGLIVANENENNFIASNFKVTILETGEEAISDSQGNFEINTKEVSDNINLLVTKDNFENRVSIEIPNDTNDTEKIVNVTINVDITNNLLSISSLYYNDKNDLQVKDKLNKNETNEPYQQAQKNNSKDPTSAASNTNNIKQTEFYGFVEGTLVALDGSPIVAAYISLERVENPINVITNIAGKFKIPFTTEQNEIRIKVSYQGQSYFTKLSRFNSDQVRIKVTLLLKTLRRDIRDIYFENDSSIKNPQLKVIKERINN